MDERKGLAARASLQRSLESPTLNLRAGGCCECQRLLAAAAVVGLRETWRHPESVRSEGSWEAETGRRKVREGTQPSAVPADCAGGRVCFLPCFALVIHLSRPASQLDGPELSEGELFGGSEQRKMQSPGCCRSEDVGFALPEERCYLKAFWPLMSFLAAAVC